MRLNEIATKVAVQDGDRHYYYWVTVANPEKAKRAALHKHRDRMGLGMTIRGNVIADHDLTATIVPSAGPEAALTMDKDREAA